MSPSPTDNPAILYAAAFDGAGNGDTLHGEQIAKAIEDDQLAWVHLDGTKAESRTWLKQEIKYLGQTVVQALLAEETRPRLLTFENGILLILRGVNLNDKEHPEDMISIRLWIDPHRIISVQKRPLKAVVDIQNRLSDPQDSSIKNVPDFLSALCVRLLERMEPIFMALDDALDDMEEQVIENPNVKERKTVSELRKKIIWFRRYLVPQRDVLLHLRDAEYPWLDKACRSALQEAHDRALRYTEDLETYRERSQVIKDELESALNERLNRNMYVLSVISAIFLPLGFLTGLLGINVGGIPGADNPQAFLIFCGMLAGIIGVQTLLFRLMRWF